MGECGNLWDLLTECPHGLDHTRAPLLLPLSALAEFPTGRQGMCEQREGIF